MKIKLHFIICILLIFSMESFISNAFGQNDCDYVTMGTGTNSTYLIPINTYYYYSYSQQIFDREDIDICTGNAIITSIAFQWSHGCFNIKDNQTIYLGNTTKNVFSNVTDWVPLSELVQVFTGTINFFDVIPNEWIFIDFDEPFVYTGENLIVAMLNNDGSYVTCVSNFLCHTAENKTIHYRVDSATQINPATPPAATGVISNRSNIKLQIICENGMEQDMQALTIEGPLTPKIEEPHDYIVTVYNGGENTICSYTVMILTESNEILSSIVINETLAPDEMAEVILPITFTEAMTGNLNIKGRVEVAGDVNPDNNETPLITLTVVKMYDIIFQQVPGAIVIPVDGYTLPVEHGGSYEFSIDLEEGYSQSNIVVFANGILINPLENVYTISNIVMDQEVTITGVELNQYQIEAQAYQGGTITPEGTILVTHGDDITFEISPNVDYIISDVVVNEVSMGAVSAFTFYNVKAVGAILAYFGYIENIHENDKENFLIFSNNNVVTMINENLIPVKRVEVLDMYGRVVWQGQPNEKRIDISLQVSAGLYAVRIITESRLFAAKILINQ